MMLYYSLKNGFLPLSLMLQNAAEFTRLTATATSALSWCINCARYNKTHLDDCFNCPVMYCTPATSILSWCTVHVLTRLTSTATWTLSWCIVHRHFNTLMMYCACYNYSHLDGCFNSFMMRCTSHNYTHLDGFFNSFVMCCTSHNYTHVDGFRVAVKGDSREANVLSTNGRVWQVERDEQSLNGQQLWNRKTSQGIKKTATPFTHQL